MDAMYSVWWNVDIDIGPTMEQILTLFMILCVIGIVGTVLVLRRK